MDSRKDRDGTEMQDVDLKASDVEAVATRKYASLDDVVNEELDRIGQGGRWIWYLFLIATLPNILNGFHVSSYVFVGKMPDSFWCEIPVLSNASWTQEEMLQISTDSQDLNSCNIYKYDYDYLSSLGYTAALEYIQARPRPEMQTCLSTDAAQMKYTLDGTSIVPEWDLVCENSVWRTIVQVAISFGKCIGASTVGIMSDKFGRKKLFASGCILFTIASLLTTFSPWYWAFLIGRFFLGSSASGLFYPPLIMMAENVAGKHRHWMGLAFNISYPLGMLYLALAAFFLSSWRDLQLALLVPIVLLIGFWYYFKESPRWLLSKGRTEEAYHVVFGKPLEKAPNAIINNHNSLEATVEAKSPRSGGLFNEVSGLYRTAKLRRIAVICHFAFFTSAFSYYVTAINAVNLSADKVIYVAATGGVDILAYLGGVVLLTYVGRKWGCFWSFALAATCMLALILMPKEETSAIVAVSMVGRLGVSCVYAIISLYTAELFPTEVRNSAVGVSSMFGHMGSMLAPFAVDFLGGVAWFIPTTICGVGLLLAAVLVLLNPETSQSKLVDYVDSPDKIETPPSDRG